MKEKVTQLAFYQTLDVVAEIVYDYYFEPETQFAVFDRIEKKVSYHPELKLEDGTILKPLELGLIKEGKLHLPSSADGYISEQKLLEEIETFINSCLDLPHQFYLKLASHYVLLTWVYDKLSVVPYLRALGDYGSGKTRFAQVIGSLCYKPLFLAGATSDAFIFRMIELMKGTMVINELERVNTDLYSQIVNILNNGYEKGLYLGRVEGEKKKEPKVFDVFCPKIITSRSKFKDLALESRILTIPMRPTKRKDIPALLDESFWDRAKSLRNKLLMYRFNNLSSIEFEDKAEKLTGVEPRLRQTLLPLFYVIQDPEVEKEFINYALEFQDELFSERSFETEALVAEKLVELIQNGNEVTVKDVGDEVNRELKEKEELTYKKVGQIIRSFGFRTKRVQGVYHIQPNEANIDYLKERYRLGIDTPEQSPPSPQSPPPHSASQVDLGDLVDIKKDTEGQSGEDIVAAAEEIFGVKATQAGEGDK